MSADQPTPPEPRSTTGPSRVIHIPIELHVRTCSTADERLIAARVADVFLDRVRYTYFGDDVVHVNAATVKDGGA